jgi:hypothetical protein
VVLLDRSLRTEQGPNAPLSDATTLDQAPEAHRLHNEKHYIPLQREYFLNMTSGTPYLLLLVAPATAGGYLSYG